MSFRKTLLAAMILTLPLAAQAQPVNGLYVAGGAGVNWRSTTTTPLSFSIRQFANFTIEPDTGWVVLGSVGWGFGNGLRIEAEGSYRQNGVGSIGITAVPGGLNIPPGGSVASTGTLRTTALMANLFYEFSLGPVRPYIGGGIGYGWVEMDNVSGLQSPIGLGGRYSGSSGRFAYQGIAGLAVPIRAVPGLAITAEYRYFATTAPTIPGFVTPVGPAQMIRPENQNQSVLLGVRYNFGRAPAAPPPAAAPAPATSFIVFFDFNRHDLTARAREIVAQAAAAARSQQVTRIEVAGHTDTVGSAQYNLGLSQRRANTVAVELVRLGVPREAIQTAGYGFSRPLVPTGPNVREPQNRRVEIVFR